MTVAADITSFINTCLNGALIGSYPALGTMQNILNALNSRSYARYRKSVNQPLTSGTPAALVWGVTAQADATGVISLVSSSRITVSEAGVYLFAATVAIGANATGSRGGWLQPNGGSGPGSRPSQVGGAAPTPPDAWQGSLAHPIKLSAGGYVEVIGYQASGSTLDAQVDVFGNECSVSIVRVG